MVYDVHLTRSKWLLSKDNLGFIRPTCILLLCTHTHISHTNGVWQTFGRNRNRCSLKWMFLSLICGSKGQWLCLTDSKFSRVHILELIILNVLLLFLLTFSYRLAFFYWDVFNEIFSSTILFEKRNDGNFFFPLRIKTNIKL